MTCISMYNFFNKKPDQLLNDAYLKSQADKTERLTTKDVINNTIKKVENIVSKLFVSSRFLFIASITSSACAIASSFVLAGVSINLVIASIAFTSLSLINSFATKNINNRLEALKNEFQGADIISQSPYNINEAQNRRMDPFDYWILKRDCKLI